MTRLCLVLALLLSISTSAAAGDVLPKLEKPFQVKAGGELIVAATGHAAPYVRDMNGDKKWDLVVGEFGGGRARIYLNGGTSEKPTFDRYTYLQGGGKDATVPSG